jgi:hypothetical protein
MSRDDQIRQKLVDAAHLVADVIALALDAAPDGDKPAKAPRRRRSGPRLARPDGPVSDIARATAKAALGRFGWTPPDR